MNSASLWIEISISGFFYFLSAVFIILKASGKNDLGFIDSTKDFLTVIAVGIAIASYLFGILAHRLLPYLVELPRKYLNRLFSRKKTQPSEGSNNRIANRVKVWQYGSERLHKEIDFQFSLRSMMFSLMFGVPMSAICAAFWIRDTSAQQLAIPIVIIGLVLGFSFYLGYRRQRFIYEQIQQAAFEEMKVLKKESRDK